MISSSLYLSKGKGVAVVHLLYYYHEISEGALQGKEEMVTDTPSSATASTFIDDIYSCDKTIFLIFGYGSLIWKQEFPFTAVYNASLYGYQRLFYQGTKDHRGTPEDPGRVVTLLPAPSLDDVKKGDKDRGDKLGSISSHHILPQDPYRVDGKAFQLPSDPEVVHKILKKLDTRERGYKLVEVTLIDFDRLAASGGFEKIPLDIFSHKNAPKDLDVAMINSSISRSQSEREENGPTVASKPCTASWELNRRKSQQKKVVSLAYIATEENSDYLGADTMDAIAATIWRCQGKSGPNKEYLFRLASSLEKMGVRDPHISELTALVRKLDQEERC